VNTIDDLKFMLQREVEAVIADPVTVQRVIDRYYGDSDAGRSNLR